MRRILACFTVFCLMGFNISAMAASCYSSRSNCPCQSCERVLCKEYLDINKKAPCNSVVITNYRKIICANNVIAVVFDCKFNSKCARAGDVINFTIPQAIYTKEGTMILPPCTKVVAEITKNQAPKWFNKNARVRLAFRYIVLPNGRSLPICAQPFTKDGMLKEGPWMTTGKIVLSTATLGIIGGGVGTGLGFIPNPAKVGVGIGAGIATGCGVGFLSALITKGLFYKAKKCEQIYIIFTNDASICY